jgi:hypothetical protein
VSKNKTVSVILPALQTTGWLFTIGFAKLGFGAGAWAIIVWPYYLGAEIVARLG